MGAISQALGQGSEFEHKGKHYKLAPWDLSVQGAFETYLEAEMIAAAEKVAARMSPDRGAVVVARIVEKIGLRRYTFGTPEVGEALSSPVHMKYMIFLQMKKADATVTRELVEEICKDRWDEIVEAADRANVPADKGSEDPNGKTPADSSAGV